MPLFNRKGISAMGNLKRVIRNEIWYILFLVPGLILFTVAVIIPFIMGTRYSFTSWDGVSTKLTFIGWENYMHAFQDPDLWKVLGKHVQICFYSDGPRKCNLPSAGFTSRFLFKVQERVSNCVFSAEYPVHCFVGVYLEI